MSDISALSFEVAFAELEQIISKLESGDLPLEESVDLFERGRQLSEHCQNLLDKAELRVNQLTGAGQITPLSGA
ncbi:MAG: exodeoxyribonuclease VII small subunit [Anaerolineaceae bacterium]|nr:exodeoxyribonuclease VII small subunit [Anaerolineaceae bacterium]